MFQDSVPAGSYNDPFLSSVCVSLSPQGSSTNDHPCVLVVQKCGDCTQMYCIEYIEKKSTFNLVRFTPLPDLGKME